MRRITLALLGTVSAVVALFSYHTSTNSPASATGTAPSSGTGSSGSSSGSGSASSGSGSGDTFTGDVAGTEWGDVQVEITVVDGKITKSEAVEYPTQNHRDQEINSYAIPELDGEVVEAQSADIDTVSGATVTSDGYLESLQSAIDQAHL